MSIDGLHAVLTLDFVLTHSHGYRYYLSHSVESADGAPHTVQIYTDASAEHAVNTADEQGAPALCTRCVCMIHSWDLRTQH